MPGGGEIHPVAAQVDPLAGVEGVQQLLARGVGPGAAQAFEQDLGGDVGFELEDVGAHVLLAVLLEVFLEAADDGDGVVGDVGHDLRHDHPVGVLPAGDGAQHVGVAVGGHGEGGAEALAAIHLEKIPGELGGRHQEDEVGVAAGEGVGHLGQPGGVAHRDGDAGNQVLRLLLEHAFDGGKAGGAEGAVGVHHRQALHADGAGVLDQLAVLAQVAGADVIHVGMHRVAEGLGGGDQADDGQLEGLGQPFLEDLPHRRRAHRQQRGDGFAGGELAEDRGGPLGLVFVVFGLEDDLLAVDAAAGVGGLDGQADPGVVFGGLDGGGAGEGGHVGHHEFARAGQRCRHGQADAGQQAVDRGEPLQVP